MNLIYAKYKLSIFELNKLYKNTILSINRKDYTSDEAEDWASCADNTTNWHQLLEEQHYVLAENREGVIVGFGSVNEAGYMHTLFVHADFQHQGIATLLYQYLEKYAQEQGAEKITSEVSITAKPFLKSKVFGLMKSKNEKQINCISPIIK